MKDPIKIIHKFKNNNRRIQYKVYIYVGYLVPKEIMTILNSIIDKDFYLTLKKQIDIRRDLISPQREKQSIQELMIQVMKS